MTGDELKYGQVPTDIEGVDALIELALDLRSEWHHGSDFLWRHLDADLWEATRNPWVVLQTVSRQRLETVLGEAQFHSDLQEFVAITSTNAAKLFGLHPQKGAIAVGADADIVVWDAEKKTTISQDILHHATDYTPYEGMQVTGWPAVSPMRASRRGAWARRTSTPGCCAGSIRIPAYSGRQRRIGSVSIS